MTKNGMDFLQKLSQDHALAEKFSTMSKDELLANAKTMGFDLTEADFTSPDKEMSESELAGVAGGQDHEPHDGKIGCFCTLVGGGGGKDEGETFGCACVAYGQGGHGQIDSFVCACLGGGIGDRD